MLREKWMGTVEVRQAMLCELAQTTQAYLDGELDAADALAHGHISKRARRAGAQGRHRSERARWCARSDLSSGG
jgi:hypothetical protein